MPIIGIDYAQPGSERTHCGVDFVLPAGDREPLEHQMLAALLHGLKTQWQAPRWADLPRKDRVPFYSATDGLV